MSITKEIVIWCDICSAWSRSLRDNAAAARLGFKAIGWIQLKGDKKYPALRDVCPLCAEKLKEQK